MKHLTDSPDGYDVYNPDNRPPTHIQQEIDQEQPIDDWLTDTTKKLSEMGVDFDSLF